MRHNRLFGLAALALLFAARSASADAMDDDDGFVGADDDAYLTSPLVQPSSDPAPAASSALPPPPVDEPPSPPPQEVASHGEDTHKPKSVVRLTFGNTSDAPARDEAASSDPHRGVLGPMRIGALAGVGAPSVFSGEVIVQFSDYVAVTGQYGMTPQIPFPIGGAAVSADQRTFTGSAHVYPFRNAIFVGAGFGSQTTSATGTATAAGTTVSSYFRTEITFLEPEVGVLWRSASGISLGCDAGLEFPVTRARTETSNIPAPMESVMKYAETGPIPNVTLLRLGYVL